MENKQIKERESNNPFKITLEEATENKRIAVYFTAHDEYEAAAKKVYYEKIAAAHPTWKSVAYYYEDDIRNCEHREERTRLLEDAIAGKFDVIITKHFGRFFFDEKENIKMILELGALPNPVGVYYEREKFFTLGNADCGQKDAVLAFLARLSDEESRLKAQNGGRPGWRLRDYGQHLEPGNFTYKTSCRVGDVFYGVDPKTSPRLVRKYTVGGILIEKEGTWYACEVENICEPKYKDTADFPDSKFRKIMRRSIEEAEEDL